MSLSIIDKNKVDARSFYNELFENETKVTPFSMWFNRRKIDYELLENQDYFTVVGKDTGGRPRVDYLLSFDCAKVLCIVDKTEKSKQYRKYLINLEKSVNKQYIIRQIGIEARKTMTDAIKESGLNDKMHGFAYSTFTKMIYKKCGIEFAKNKDFRDTLDAEQLKVVEQYEKIVGAYIEMGFDYSQIKEQIPNFMKKVSELEVTNG